MDFLAHSLAVDELHGDEIHAVALTNFMDGRNVWMIESGRSLGFANEAFHAIRLRRNFRRQNLQRNFAIQLVVTLQILFAHSAFANLRADFVAAEFGADLKRHLRDSIILCSVLTEPPLSGVTP